MSEVVTWAAWGVVVESLEALTEAESWEEVVVEAGSWEAGTETLEAWSEEAAGDEDDTLDLLELNMLL